MECIMSTEHINNMIANIAAGENVQAGDNFIYAMNQKIADAIEAKRVEVAQSFVPQGNGNENIQSDS